MIWMLFCALVVVQRMQLNCCGFSNGSAKNKIKKKGKDKKEGGEALIVKDIFIFPKIVEVCERV